MKDDSVIQRANLKINHDAQAVVEQLKRLSGLKSGQRTKAIQRANAVANQTVKQLKKSASRANVERTVRRVHLQMIKLITKERIVDLMNTEINNVHDSALSDVQQAAAIQSIRQACAVNNQQLADVHHAASVKMTYTLSSNAIRGAMLKYATVNKVNALKQLNDAVKDAKRVIDKQDADGVIHKMAERILSQVVDMARTQLKSETDFNQITSVKHRALNQIDKLTGGRHTVDHDSKQLKAFGKRSTMVISELSAVDAARKWNAQQQIVKLVIAAERHLHKARSDQTGIIIDTCKRYVSRMVWSLIVADHQARLKSVKNAKSQHDLADRIKTVSGLVRYQIKTAPADKLRSIIENGQHKLTHVDTDTQHQVEADRVDQAIKSAVTHVRLSTSIAAADRHRSIIQLKTFGSLAHKDKADWSLDRVHRTLHRFLAVVDDKLPGWRYAQRIDRVRDRIQGSHLKAAVKESLLQKLSRVQEAATASLPQIIQLAITNDIQENGERANRITKFAYDRIQKSERPKRYLEALRRLSANFTWHRNRSVVLVRIDHREQTYEDQVVKILLKMTRSAQTGQQIFKSLDRMAQRVQRRVNASIQGPEYTRTLRERIDHLRNVRIQRIIRATDEKAAHAQLTQFKAGIAQLWGRMRIDVRHRDVQRLKMASHDTYGWLLLGDDAQHRQSKTASVVAAQMSMIQRAADVTEADHAEQVGARKLNRLVNGVVDSVDAVRRKAHQKLNDQYTQVMKPAGEHPNAVLNHVMLTTNWADERIDFSDSADVEAVLNRYQRTLLKLARQYERQQLDRTIDRFRPRIQDQLKSNGDYRTKIVAKVELLRQKTADQIKSANQGALPKLRKRTRTALQGIVHQVANHDPVKRHARQRLLKLVDRIKALIAEMDRKDVRQELTHNLDHQTKITGQRIQQADDDDVDQILKGVEKPLFEIRTRLMRNVQLQKLSHRIDRDNDNVAKQMKLLNVQEVRKWRAKLNRSYHKAVYQISQVSDPKKFAEVEETGEREIKAQYDRIKHWSYNKQLTYESVNSQIQLIWSRIKAMHNLQDKEKKASHQLFEQIHLQSRVKIQKARTVKQLITAKIQCELLVQKVADKIHSAGILVTAIREAHHQVTSSDLDKQQKEAALRQINHVISSGLDSVEKSGNLDEKRKADERAKKKAAVQKAQAEAEQEREAHHRHWWNRLF